MLILAGQAAIKCFMGPACFHICINFPCAGIDHWLYGEHHALLQAQPSSCGTIIRHHWLFMHGWPNTMTDKVSNHTVAMTFSILLDCCTNVTNAVRSEERRVGKEC